MKILRTLRRRKIKLSFIFLLLIFLIFNTYAWMTTEVNNSVGGIALEVSGWDVAFVINNEEIKTEEYVFEIDEFYPGITTPTNPIQKRIEVWNLGDANSFIEYKITDIYFYGVQIYKELENSTPETIGEETVNADQQKTANIFGNQTAQIFDENNEYYKFLVNEEENEYRTFSLDYPTPFTISYTYGLTHISGSGKDNELGSRSEMIINIEWNNSESNNEDDTEIGNLAYAYKNAKDNEGNLLYYNEEKGKLEPVLKIVANVTAKREGEIDKTYAGNGVTE